MNSNGHFCIIVVAVADAIIINDMVRPRLVLQELRRGPHWEGETDRLVLRQAGPNITQILVNLGVLVGLKRIMADMDDTDELWYCDVWYFSIGVIH